MTQARYARRRTLLAATGTRRSGGAGRVMVLPEHEQRFQRIVSDYLERPGGDYDELLHRGRASSPDGVDPEQWRGDIRRQARQDKIRVTTRRDGPRAFAMLNPSLSDELANALMREAVTRVPELQRLLLSAARLGHDPISWLRSDDEYVSVCSRCGARIYMRFGPEAVEDGEALTDPCRGE